jgi:hypothetical protein
MAAAWAGVGLVVVTGRGRHSADGAARVRAAAEAVLTDTLLGPAASKGDDVATTTEVGALSGKDGGGGATTATAAGRAAAEFAAAACAKRSPAEDVSTASTALSAAAPAAAAAASPLAAWRRAEDVGTGAANDGALWVTGAAMAAWQALAHEEAARRLWGDGEG